MGGVVTVVGAVNVMIAFILWLHFSFVYYSAYTRWEFLLSIFFYRLDCIHVMLDFISYM